MSVKKVILLFIFLFLLMACSKKKEVEKIIDNDENIIKINVFEYRGTPNYDYNDIKNLLLKMNIKETDSIWENNFHFGDTFEYLSFIKIDIDTTEGETWFSSWHINDSNPSSYSWLYLHIIKNDNIIKTDRIPVYPDIQNTFRMLSLGDKDNVFGIFGYKFIRFPILDNLPGQFYPPFNSEIPGTYLYDVNKDGFDEIICVSDLGSKDYPKAVLKIVGFNKDKFITYLDITTITMDEETGPEPIQYIENQNFWGFRCLVESSEYTSLYGIPLTKKEDFIWVFFTWDSNERKYIEKEYIED